VDQKTTYSENSYREIFESIDDAIFIFDFNNGEIIDFNLSACAMFGYQHKEFIKLHVGDISAVDEGYTEALALEKLKEAFEMGHVSTEWQAKRANDDIFWCNVQLKKSFINGEYRIMAVIKDISEQKTALDKLKFNEEQYRTLVSNIPGAVYRCQVYFPWKTLYFSNEILSMSGYSAEEFMTREITFGDIMHPEDKPVVESITEKALKEHHDFNLEYRITHKDGSIRWMLEKGKAKYNENDLPIWFDGVILDITEKKLIEKGLQDERNLMRTMFDTVRVNIYIKDTQSRFVLANSPICKLFGKELDELVGKTDFDFFNNEKAREFFNDEQEIIKTGKAIESKTEYMFDYKGEEAVLITSKMPLYNSEGSIIGIVGSGIDITDRIHTERKLEEERNILRAIFDTIPINLYLKDRQSRMLIANKTITNPIGFPAVDVIGKTDFDFFTKEQAQEFYDDEQKMMETGVSIIGKPEHMINNLGQEFTMLTSKVPLFDSEGKIIGFVGFGVDITARVEAENKIKLLNENLEHIVEERTSQLAQANKDLEAFAYSISHDLRAPLRHIDGFLKLLYSNIDNPSNNATIYFEKINAALKRMAAMIDDLLSFSRLGRKKLNICPVDLNIVIKEIIELTRPDTRERKIEWKLNPLPKVMADKDLIRIAFENLLSNAVKYTSKKENAIIEIGYNKLNNSQVEIFIKDNGAGFNMEYVSKLFGVFQRLHLYEEYEGTGIGLANVKQIITKHNGSIRAEGKVNEGATFFITLLLS
jgi:PAS domain S-box-containing protein